MLAFWVCLREDRFKHNKGQTWRRQIYTDGEHAQMAG